MYEQHYGLSAPAFQINPDPGFYFESKGHGRAYQYLRFGAFQGEGFIVVTGEIGAGKTTLLRALLAELDPEKVVAAQLVSTQLGSDDLLSAVALAFGIRVEDQSKAKLLVTLEAFLAALATSGRRALLVIDEAQNLSTEAIEELRMLSNFQFGNRALLQSFLVGQPELRDMLQQPRMEQLRQRVLASCHLGPMEPLETRGYIEHRLRRVGWNQNPRFDSEAFDAIHRVTGGLPRRINTLCNRLMLSAYLDEAQHIGADRVQRVDLEMRAEVSGQVPAFVEPGARVAAPLLCVAGSRQGLLAIGALLRACAAREDLPPVTLMRIVGEAAIADDSAAVADLRGLGVRDPGLCVVLSSDARAQAVAEVTSAVAAQIQMVAPGAMLVAGAGWVDAACAALAAGSDLPLIRVDCCPQGGAGVSGQARLRALLDGVGSLVLTSSEAASASLRVLSDTEVRTVGSLAADAMRLALEHSVEPEQTLRREGVSLSVLADPAGYALVCLGDTSLDEASRMLIALDGGLRKLGWRVPLVCSVAATHRKALADACAREAAASVRVISSTTHAEWLGLLRHARCVLSADSWLKEQATALGVPVLDVERVAPDEKTERVEARSRKLAQALADIIASGGRQVALPEGFDGHAGERAAAFLSDWLLARQDSQYRQYLEGA